jgi:hypothetical protein
MRRSRMCDDADAEGRRRSLPRARHIGTSALFDEFAELAGIGDGRSGWLSRAPFRRVISRLPATLHDGIREQIDRPSTLVTDWLNLYTPVGREYVGHRRVDHERRVRPRRTVGVQLHRDPYLSPVLGAPGCSGVGCYVRVTWASRRDRATDSGTGSERLVRIWPASSCIEAFPAGAGLPIWRSIR